MTITFSEKDFRAMEDTIGQIRAGVRRACIAADLMTMRLMLQEIVTQANTLTNLLLNGDVDGESIKASIGCPHCGGVDAHRVSCPWA